MIKDKAYGIHTDIDTAYGMHRDGGKGSGNYGHAGIPGQRGGSASSKGYTGVAGRNYGSFDVPRTSKNSTLAKYVKDGKLTPEREALHKQIIDSLFKDIPKAEGQATMTFMGGGPASGKSSVLKDDSIQTPDRKKTVCIDSDAIKAKIPEYHKAIKDGKSDTAADMCHEESSMIAWKALEIAQNEGYNCMMDGTGDGSVEGMRKSIQEAKDKGMKVQGIYVTCDTDEAVRRADNRAKTEKRKVPEERIRQTHQKVSAVLPAVAKDYDDVKLYATDKGSKPVLVAEGGNGKGLKAVDQDLYNEFLTKENESLPYHLANPQDYNVNNK